MTEYQCAARFDCAIHGAVAGSWCQTLGGPCACEMGEGHRCPLSEDECEDQENLVFTEGGWIVPDPLDEGVS